MSASHKHRIVPSPSRSIPPTHVHIHLHGRAEETASPASYIPNLASSLPSNRRLSELYPHTSYIFPAAPVRGEGYAAHPCWFDRPLTPNPVPRYDDPAPEIQTPGLKETVQHVHGIIKEQISSGIPSERILLTGFSQGCAAALVSLLCWDSAEYGELGAMVGWAGYLPFCRQMLEESADIREVLGLRHQEEGGKEKRVMKTPVVLGTGREDERVPFALMEKAGECLTKFGFRVQREVYQGLGHWMGVPAWADSIVKVWKMREGGGGEGGIVGETVSKEVDMIDV